MSKSAKKSAKKFAAGSLAELASIPGITVMSLGDPAELHSVIAQAVGEADEARETLAEMAESQDVGVEESTDEVAETAETDESVVDDEETAEAMSEIEESLGVLPAPLPPMPAAPAPAPAPAAPATVTGRRTSYDTSHVIVVLRSNPKMAGTAGFARYAVYESGMTVAAYLSHKSIGKFGRADIRWDLDRGFIRIVTPAVWAEMQAEAQAEKEEA